MPPPRNTSCATWTVPWPCGTPPPSSATAANSASAPRSASPPGTSTPADRSGWSSLPPTATSSAAPGRYVPERAPNLEHASLTTPLACDPVPRFGDRRRSRVGLLGGSFNPAHAGHRHIAEVARRRLRLDQVWLLVSPGNPLKPQRGMANLALRVASAWGVADGRRVVASAIESRLGTRFTIDTLRLLQRRFPRVEFVWIAGADIFVQLPRW